MILHYAGKYNGDENTLPQRKHHPKAVAFKEMKDMKTVSIISNICSVLLIVVLAVPFILLSKDYMKDNTVFLALGGVLGAFSLPLHEFLHAICYKKDVYFYNNLSQGLMFVVGVEDMSKLRFVFMCLCPNIILGFIPYTVCMIFPNLVFFGLFGLICIAVGFGDYINVYNALRQMPKGAKTYLCGMHSYWYQDD